MLLFLKRQYDRTLKVGGLAPLVGLVGLGLDNTNVSGDTKALAPLVKLIHLGLVNTNVTGREKEIRGSGGSLEPPGLFLRTSIPFIWHILSACLPTCTPWLRGPVSPR